MVIVALAGCSSAAPQSSGSPATSAATANGSPTTRSATTTTTTAATQSSAQPDRTIAITVRGKQVSPSPSRIELRSDQALRLLVTIDHDDDLHAHGFGVERALVAGQPATIDLKGAPPGLYEVETHNPELRLLQVVVRP